MEISQQKLKKIKIENLKGLIDVEIDFTEKPLVAILGPNGVGKSTILHAIACINKPINNDDSVNYKFSNFFIPTPHSIWNDSSFFAYQDFREGSNETIDYETNFHKETDRWAPRYGNRKERYVSFIGIKTCLPAIEKETRQSRIQFNTIPLDDATSTKVKELAGAVLNKKYVSYNRHNSGNTEYLGVSTETISYSSLSMGAGEQRVFYILSEVVKAPNYGLIIIDEIDLLLHQDALFKLMKELNKIATDKKLQIIFTTHSQALLSLDFIAVRHLYQTPQKTLCFNDTKPDALQRLTGKQIRPLEIFVEDDLAQCLIKKICAQEGMAKYVSIKEFGAARNCFTAVCGSILNNLDNQENMLFVLDGDVYKTDEEKEKQIGKVLTGTTDDNNTLRATALTRITQFVLSDGEKPEKYYHSLICNIDDNKLNNNEEYMETLRVARDIQNVGDSHKFFDNIIERMGYDRRDGLKNLVNLLSLTSEWDNIKRNIKIWLENRKDKVIENNN